MDNNAMLFRARWHLVEKYDLMTGAVRNPIILYANKIDDRHRRFKFEPNIQMEAHGSPTDGDHWLLVAKRDSISCLPTAVRYCTSLNFAFLILNTDEEYAMAKMAYTFREPEGYVPVDWSNEGLVSMT